MTNGTPDSLEQTLEQLRRALREKEASDAALMRAQQMALLAHVVTGPDGVFESYSETLPDLLGLVPARMPKSTREWLTLVHPDDRLAFRAAAISAGESGSRTRVEYRLARADRMTIHLRQLMEPLANRGVPDSARWFSTIQDITVEKRAQEAVEQLNVDLERRVRERTAELEAANRELAAFDYSITHDLRAPLRHIQGFAKALEEAHGAPFAPEALEYLERIVTASRRMDQLINDLYKLSTASRSQLTRMDVDVGAMAHTVFAILSRADPKREVELVVGAGLVAQADRGLLHVALENLIANAWKFTGACEHPRIEVGRSPEGAYYVSDNGVGFDMEYADKLFTPFRRLHAGFEGSGIGLATVRRIVERHGGRVWAMSSPGQGAAFYFTLG